jgi:hypothetical protein
MSAGKRATLPIQLAVAAASMSLVVLPACGDDGGSTSTAGEGGTSTTAEAPVIDPGDGGNYQPKIDPADFVRVIDNPYLPYPVGASWTYEGTEDGETENVKVTVTPQRKVIMGISATVVRDTVSTADGEVVEDTYDWFAQDRDGNVWYLGEDSTEFENGKAVSTSGSWEAGVDGALPGIVMQAHPEVGQAYRQEYYVGEAEDLAEVKSLDATETVPFGDFDQLVVIKEWNPLEPDVVEEKYYARDVGVVVEIKTEGGTGRSELVDHTPGA